MDYQVVQQPPLQIMGIELKTSKVDGQELAEIGAHWERFYTESIPTQIPQKLGDEITALYTDYANDEYALVLGCWIDGNVEPIEGFVIKKVPASRYAHFKIDGPFPDSLIEVWEMINSSDIPRSYTGDFELYGPHFHPENGPHFELFISLL